MSQEPPNPPLRPANATCQNSPLPCSRLALWHCLDCKLLLCAAHDYNLHSSSASQHQRTKLTTTAEIELVVPISAIDHVINPYGDMFTCRPVEYLRKCFDELASVLRWWVVYKLEKGEAFFLQLHHVDEETGRKENNRGTYLCSYQASSWLWKQLESTKKRFSAVQWHFHPWYNPAGHGLAVAFFQLWSSFDCGQLLTHILAGPYIKNDEAARHAAEFLKQLRDIMAHRGYLSRQILPFINEYIITAISEFFVAVESFLPKPSALDDDLYSKQFTVHREQLLNMRHMIPFFSRQLALQGGASGQSRDKFHEFTKNAFSDSLLFDHQYIDAHEFLNSCISGSTNQQPPWSDLATVFACRYRVRRSTPITWENVENSQLQEEEESSDGNITPLSKALKRWNMEVEGPSEDSYTSPDPVSVTNNDILFRAYDCLALIHHEYLMAVLENMNIDEAKTLLGLRDSMSVYTLTNNLYKLPVKRLPSESPETLESMKEHKSLTDPTFLLTIFRNEKHFPTSDTRPRHTSSLRAIRHKLAHQHFVQDPVSLNQALVSEGLGHILSLVALLEEDPRLLFNQRCKQLRVYLESLQESISGAYTRFRWRTSSVHHKGAESADNKSYRCWTAFTMEQIRKDYADSQETRSLVQRFCIPDPPPAQPRRLPPPPSSSSSSSGPPSDPPTGSPSEQGWQQVGRPERRQHRYSSTSGNDTGRPSYQQRTYGSPSGENDTGRSRYQQHRYSSTSGNDTGRPSYQQRTYGSPSGENDTGRSRYQQRTYQQRTYGSPSGGNDTGRSSYQQRTYGSPRGNEANQPRKK